MVEDVTAEGPSEIRRKLAVSADPRPARTRTAIVAALKDAVASGEPVSVSSLARRAGISRSAFYTHFATLDDLAVYALDEVFKAVAEQDVLARSSGAQSGADTARRSLRVLVDHLSAHRQLYGGLFATSARSPAQSAIVDRFTDVTRRVLPYVDNPPEGVNPDASAAFVGAGIMGLLGSWLRGELDLDPEGAVEQLLRVIPPWMASD